MLETKMTHKNDKYDMLRYDKSLLAMQTTSLYSQTSVNILYSTTRASDF